MGQNENFEFLSFGLPDDIQQKKYFGDIDGAVSLIDRRLETVCDDGMRASLTAQREMILRQAEDYPFTRAQAIARAQRDIPDFSEEDFDTLVQDGRIRWIYLQGQPRYFGRFFESLVKTHPDISRRAGVPFGGEEHVKQMLSSAITKITQEGKAANKITVRSYVRIKDECFSPGERVRVHLPLPCSCPEQSDIQLLSIDPPTGKISPPDAAQRTICWEEQMQENHAFTVEYSYLYTAKYHDTSRIVPDAIQPTFDTHEKPPHIVFSPLIRQVTDTLIKGLDNPLDKARAIYDFISLQITYSFMPSYFCLERIAESCLQTMQGDCGVMALLFITMCRYAKIPARWQSGLNVRPDFCGAHDWAMFYVAPYGWLFADPSFGTAAVRRQDETARKFYFGNIDFFRMAANSEIQAPFTIPKQYWRADPYDNQVGEIETAHRALRYCEYERGKQVLSFQAIEPPQT